MDPGSALFALLAFIGLLDKQSASSAPAASAPGTTPGTSPAAAPGATAAAPTIAPAPGYAPPSAPSGGAMPVPGYVPPTTPGAATTPTTAPATAPTATPPASTAPSTTTPWPGTVPSDVPAFPGTGWTACQTTPDIVARAQYWNPKLWNFASKSIVKPFVTEQYGGKWVTFKAAWHPGSKGAQTYMATEAYCLKGSASAQPAAQPAAQPGGGTQVVTTPEDTTANIHPQGAPGSATNPVNLDTWQAPTTTTQAAVTPQPTGDYVAPETHDAATPAAVATHDVLTSDTGDQAAVTGLPWLPGMAQHLRTPPHYGTHPSAPRSGPRGGAAPGRSAPPGGSRRAPPPPPAPPAGTPATAPGSAYAPPEMAPPAAPPGSPQQQAAPSYDDGGANYDDGSSAADDGSSDDDTDDTDDSSDDGGTTMTGDATDYDGGYDSPGAPDDDWNLDDGSGGDGGYYDDAGNFVIPAPYVSPWHEPLSPYHSSAHAPSAPWHQPPGPYARSGLRPPVYPSHSLATMPPHRMAAPPRITPAGPHVHPQMAALDIDERLRQGSLPAASAPAHLLPDWLDQGGGGGGGGGGGWQYAMRPNADGTWSYQVTSVHGDAGPVLNPDPTGLAHTTVLTPAPYVPSEHEVWNLAPGVFEEGLTPYELRSEAEDWDYDPDEEPFEDFAPWRGRPAPPYSGSAFRRYE